MSIRAVVHGIGRYVPEKVLSNADLERMVDTTDEWIMQRTGIKERRMCSDDESASTLAIEAAKEALASAKLAPEDVQIVIVGCVTGDYLFPSVSCLVQQAIGAKNAGAFDVGAACAGFIYSLNVATAMIESGQVTNALVIGSDALTKFVDFTDRSTCVLFGDGAGAVVLRAETGTDRGVIDTVTARRRIRCKTHRPAVGRIEVPCRKATVSGQAGPHLYGRLRGLPICGHCNG